MLEHIKFIFLLFLIQLLFLFTYLIPWIFISVDFWSKIIAGSCCHWSTWPCMSIWFGYPCQFFWSAVTCMWAKLWVWYGIFWTFLPPILLSLPSLFVVVFFVEHKATGGTWNILAAYFRKSRRSMLQFHCSSFLNFLHYQVLKDWVHVDILTEFLQFVFQGPSYLFIDAPT